MYLETILNKFPHAVHEKDFEFQDDGEGVYISKWELEEPKPEKDELKAWHDEYAAENDPVVQLSLEEQLEQERSARKQIELQNKRLESMVEGLNNDLLSFIEFQITGGN